MKPLRAAAAALAVMATLIVATPAGATAPSAAVSRPAGLELALQARRLGATANLGTLRLSGGDGITYLGMPLCRTWPSSRSGRGPILSVDLGVNIELFRVADIGLEDADWTVVVDVVDFEDPLAVLSSQRVDESAMSELPRGSPFDPVPRGFTISAEVIISEPIADPANWPKANALLAVDYIAVLPTGDQLIFTDHHTISTTCELAPIPFFG